MDWCVKAFIKASLVWLTLGVTLGVAMAAHPVWTIYRPAHVHMLVLGFVTMMIFGVEYHVMSIGGVFSAMGAYAFAYVIWRTINASAVLPMVAALMQRSQASVASAHS